MTTTHKLTNTWVKVASAADTYQGQNVGVTKVALLYVSSGDAPDAAATGFILPAKETIVSGNGKDVYARKLNQALPATLSMDIA